MKEMKMKMSKKEKMVDRKEDKAMEPKGKQKIKMKMGKMKKDCG